MWPLNTLGPHRVGEWILPGMTPEAARGHSELKDWLVVHGEGRDEREEPLLTFRVRHGLKRSYRNFTAHPLGPPSFLLLIRKLEVGRCLLELRQPEVSECSFHSISTGAINLAHRLNSA